MVKIGVDYSYSNYTDEELVIEFNINRTEKAFEILMKRYKNSLLNYVFRFLGDYELGADIVQETFIRVFRSLESYNGKAKFSTWIYTIAINLSRTEFQRRKRYSMLSIHDSSLVEQNDEGNSFEHQIEDNRYRPDKMVEDKNIEESIQKALLLISDTNRELIILRDVQGMSYEEIADIMNLPLGTVKSRINRGREQLQKLLKDLR